jgi:hypothetical protein
MSVIFFAFSSRGYPVVYSDWKLFLKLNPWTFSVDPLRRGSVHHEASNCTVHNPHCIINKEVMYVDNTKFRFSIRCIFPRQELRTATVSCTICDQCQNRDESMNTVLCQALGTRRRIYVQTTSVSRLAKPMLNCSHTAPCVRSCVWPGLRRGFEPALLCRSSVSSVNIFTVIPSLEAKQKFHSLKSSFKYANSYVRPSETDLGQILRRSYVGA